MTCFLCSKSLTGWDEQDDPVLEHLNHSPQCGWAITAAIQGHLGQFEEQNPNSEAMIEARKMTFAGRWPHEGKKGFKCKTKQVSSKQAIEHRGFLPVFFLFSHLEEFPRR